MKSYANQCGNISDKDVEILNTSINLFKNLPDEVLGPDTTLSCHHIAHSLVRIFKDDGFYVVDGFFRNKGLPHSWLEKSVYPDPLPNDRKIIFDVYPRGGVLPFMVYSFSILPRRRFYKKAGPIQRKQIANGLLLTEGFQNQVDLLTNEMIKVLK